MLQQLLWYNESSFCSLLVNCYSSRFLELWCFITKQCGSKVKCWIRNYLSCSTDRNIQESWSFICSLQILEWALSIFAVCCNVRSFSSWCISTLKRLSLSTASSRGTDDAQIKPEPPLLWFRIEMRFPKCSCKLDLRLLDLYSLAAVTPSSWIITLYDLVET